MGVRIFCGVVFLFFISFSFNVEAESFAELKARAEAGDAQAQYAYAEELGWNMGTPKMASPWWRKSAAQSYPYAIIANAEYELAQISKHSKSTELETKEKEYFEKSCPKIKNAIEQIEKESTAEAFYNLGDVYFDGICVKMDQEKALELYRKAAEMGLGAAQLRLANIFNGRKGEAEGVKWLQKASHNNMLKAKVELASLYFRGKGVEKNEQKGIDLVKEVEDSNSPMGLTYLGALYSKGRLGFPKDIEKGKELLKRAADMDFKPAIRFLEKNKTD